MEAFKRAVDYHPPAFSGLDSVEPALNPHHPTRRNSVTAQSKVVIVNRDDDDSLIKIKMTQTNNSNNNKGPNKPIRTQSFTGDYYSHNDLMAPVGSFKTNNSTAKNPVRAAFEIVQQAWGKTISVQANDRFDQPTLFQFRYLDVIGNGTFGIVCRARDLDSGAVVAIKTVFQDQDHQNRELDIIKRLVHPNVVALYKYFYTQNECGEEFLSLVLEYLPTSLDKLLKSECASANMTPQAVQRIMSGFLKGVDYLHSQGICHRDIKPHNLLVDLQNDQIKLCDFGCAKRINPNEPNIQYICARYYRAPEITLGWSNYSTPIDMWSVGCVLAEMLRHGKPIFTGKNSVDQWGRIVKILGVPTMEEFLAMGQEPRKRPSSTEPLSKADRRKALSKVVPTANEEALNLLIAMFEYDPRQRIMAKQALQHEYILMPTIPLKSAVILNGGGGSTLSTLDYSNERNPKAAM